MTTTGETLEAATSPLFSGEHCELALKLWLKMDAPWKTALNQELVVE